MDLTASDPVSHRPRALLVTCPGATAVRLAAESAVVALGGRLASSPADADVLLVAGRPSADMRAVTESLWAQLPGPAARLTVTEPERVAESLREVLPGLTRARTCPDTEDRNTEGEGTQPHGEAGGHGRHDGHAGHVGSEADMVAGLPMAERAEDRDGLKLDVLHVPLGPWLPHWPAGLVIDTRLQGEVIQHAKARPLSARVPFGTPFWDAEGDPVALRRRSAAAHLDSLVRLLAVAGWGPAADRARWLRDRALGEEPAEGLLRDFRPWRRRIARSRLLRWATDGLGVLTPAHAARLGVGGPAARSAEPWDATARWRQWLAETERLLGGERAPEAGPRGQPNVHAVPSRALLGTAVELMPGLDLASARVLVASLDPDPDELAWAEPPSPAEGSP